MVMIAILQQTQLNCRIDTHFNIIIVALPTRRLLKKTNFINQNSRINFQIQIRGRGLKSKIEQACYDSGVVARRTTNCSNPYPNIKVVIGLLDTFR